MPGAPVDVQVGDIVQTRKGHPCGSDRWQVYRIGADIGLRCQGCERRVMLPRRQFEKAVKKWISRPREESKEESTVEPRETATHD